jgi:hypothetical protein
MREVIEDNIKLGMVVYACNPSYLASRHKEIGELKNSLGKVSMTCSQENKNKSKQKGWGHSSRSTPVFSMYEALGSTPST